MDNYPKHDCGGEIWNGVCHGCEQLVGDRVIINLVKQEDGTWGYSLASHEAAIGHHSNRDAALRDAFQNPRLVKFMGVDRTVVVIRSGAKAALRS